MSTNIPTADELRADIETRTTELRALRRLLRLAKAAEAAEAARQARATQQPIHTRTDRPVLGVKTLEISNSKESAEGVEGCGTWRASAAARRPGRADA